MRDTEGAIAARGERGRERWTTGARCGAARRDCAASLRRQARVYSFHHCVPGVTTSFVCDDRDSGNEPIGRNMPVQRAPRPNPGETENGRAMGAAPAGGWHASQSCAAAAAESLRVLSPCLCLCFGLRAQMTNRTRWRRTISHLSQMRRREERIFMRRGG